MSYSSRAKTELCEAKLRCKACSCALLYGMLLFNRNFTANGISLFTESRATAALFMKELVEQTGVIVTMTQPSLRERNQRPLYSVVVEDEGEAASVCRAFFLDDASDLSIRQELLANDCCRIAFLRGVWLVCGTMSNPEKEYHFEFSVSGEERREELLFLLEEMGMDFRVAARGKGYVLYIKESEQLEDTLARLGAVRLSLDLMNLKMEKDLRNQVNRVTNCETANLSKTINAALLQIEKITALKETSGFKSLPPQLREAAELRLAHPDASLRELCELSDGKLSRSGLNHRLKKLCELADQLAETK